jgi:hypothetical protein
MNETRYTYIQEHKDEMTNVRLIMNVIGVYECGENPNSAYKRAAVSCEILGISPNETGFFSAYSIGDIYDIIE